MLKKIFPLAMMVAFAGCTNIEGVSDGHAENSPSSKPPLEFDESSILVPPDIASIRAKFKSRVAEDQIALKALPKAASTHYTYGIGNGLSSADYELVYPSHSNSNTNCLKVFPNNPSFVGCAGNNFLEATYSSRFNSYPEQLWVHNGNWLQSGDLNDNEQAEIHFTWDMTGGAPAYWVEVDYEVSSEANYDYLWINSTGIPGVCNNPGVVRRKVAGQESGTVSFSIYRDCGTAWVGIYYIKDYSVSQYGDYGRIKNVRITSQWPTGS